MVISRKTNSVTKGMPTRAILETTGMTEYNLKLAWRFLAPHFEGVLLKFKLSGRFLL